MCIGGQKGTKGYCVILSRLEFKNMLYGPKPMSSNDGFEYDMILYINNLKFSISIKYMILYYKLFG